MTNRYFYEFSGRVYLEADHEDQAEELITGISLDDYLVDEELYAIDETYVPLDLEMRQRQFGTIHHPLDQATDFESFKIRKCLYEAVFKDFLDGKINRQELIERIDQTEFDNTLDGCEKFAKIEMVDLKTKKTKIARLIAVD